jgi:hypothetical protein
VPHQQLLALLPRVSLPAWIPTLAAAAAGVLLAHCCAPCLAALLRARWHPALHCCWG